MKTPMSKDEYTDFEISVFINEMLINSVLLVGFPHVFICVTESVKRVVISFKTETKNYS